MKAGVSLIELLIVVAIMAVLGGAAIPISSNFLVRSYLENKTNEVVGSLKTAQVNTLSGKEDDQWGVYIGSGEIIMFKGPTYIAPGTPFDQRYDIPSSISITPTQIVFEKLTGDIASSTTITISANEGSGHTLTVNEMGVVDVD